MLTRMLVICHRIPYPPNKGDKIRSFNFIRHLSSSHDVHLAFMVDDRNDLKHIGQLQEFSKSLFFETITPSLKRITSAGKALLSTSQPISIPYFYSTKLQEKIDSFLDGNTIDCVFCFSSPTAEYIFNSKHYHGRLKDIPWIMDLIDVDSYKWRQYADTSSQPLRWLYRREADYLLQYEKRIVKEFHQTLLVSESEKKLLSQYIPTPTTRVVGNGVDLQYFAPVQSRKQQNMAPKIVFTGAMDYWPNIDGVEWFAKAVFSLVRAKLPEVTFQIVGSNPPKRVQKLAKIHGVSVTGYVTDIREYIAAADICVIPLRIARGIQNKVLEAMSMGKAVVCTAEAMEGIKAEKGRDLIVAGDADAFSSAIIMLLDNQNFRSELGGKARKCIEASYSWEKVLKDIDRLLLESGNSKQEI